MLLYFEFCLIIIVIQFLYLQILTINHSYGKNTRENINKINWFCWSSSKTFSQWVQHFGITFQLRTSTCMFFHTVLPSMPLKALRMQHFIKESATYSSGTFFQATDTHSVRFNAGIFLILKKVSKCFQMAGSTSSFPKATFKWFPSCGITAWCRQCSPPPNSHQADCDCKVHRVQGAFWLQIY